MKDLHKFFYPKTIAIIGASSNPEKLGYHALNNLSKFKGKVYPVTLHADEILGHKCYKTLMDVPDKIDLAAILTPAEAVPHIVRECGWKGVKNVIIYSGGFSEVGNTALQNEILEIAKKFKIRIIGPNTNGLHNLRNNMNIQMQNIDKQTVPKFGPVAFVSQSGTVLVWFMEWAALNNVGVSKYVSYGNRSDVDEADIIEYLSKDNDTKIIGLYVEGDIRDKLKDAVSNCKKPIVLLKVGKTQTAKDEIPKHTGTNAGDYHMVFGTKCLLCESVDEMFGIIKALVMLPKPKNFSIGYVTSGVGPFILIEEQLSYYPHGGLNEETVNKLMKNMHKGTIINNNIVDTTGTVTPEDYEKAISIMSKTVGAIVVGWVYQNPWSQESIDRFMNVLIKARKKNKAIMVLTYGGPKMKYIVDLLQENNIPVYNEPSHVVEAIRALIYYGGKTWGNVKRESIN